MKSRSGWRTVALVAVVTGLGGVAWLLISKRDEAKQKELIESRVNRSEASPIDKPAEPPPRETKGTSPEPEPPTGDSAETPVKEPGVPKDEGGPESQSALETTLTPTLASFLTEKPEIVALNEAVRSLAASAKVRPESIHRDEEDGTVTGVLSIAGTALEGSFRIEDGNYSVTIPVPLGLLPEETTPYFKREITLGFHELNGSVDTPHAMVQFHPNTKQDPRQVLREGEERHVGYNVSVTSEGARAQPWSMRRQGSSWMIGVSQDLPIVECPLSDPSAFNLWLRVLEGYSR